MKSTNAVNRVADRFIERRIEGSLQHFWKILDSDGYVLNWSGERSPVVHQLNHFVDELRLSVVEGQNRVQGAGSTGRSTEQPPSTAHEQAGGSFRGGLISTLSNKAKTFLATLSVPSEAQMGGDAETGQQAASDSNLILKKAETNVTMSAKSKGLADMDLAWQALAASRCLWGC